MATAVLHNLSILWKQPEPEDEEEEEDEEEDPQEVQRQPIVGSRERIRLEGAALRDRLLANMPPATPEEARRIRRR